ncbi:MAG TPA: hypothetical protein VK446_16775 [Methylocystis sp.]|nr:hypothetical protein [Methylocystis sp.]
MSIQQSTNEVLDAIRKSQTFPIGDPRLGALQKSTFQQPTSAISGLNFYDLEPGAKFLAPVLTPLRNETPRVSGVGGIQANWRAITGVNTTGLRLGVSGGNRGGVQAISTADYYATYKGIGLETSVDFEAEYAGMGFDDVRAQAGLRGLQATMLGEEALILGGNTSSPLGLTPTPTLAANAGGGSLASGTLSVICVALSLDGVINGSIANGVQSQITRTNADGSVDVFGGGAAQKSANATVAVAGPTGLVTASVALVRGALGYAWFWGPAGSEVLGAITTLNSVSITGNAAGTQTAASLPAADWSNNALVFDGLMTIATKSGSNAYFAAQPTGTAGVGTPLTADGAGGVIEIDAALKSLWDNYRLSPDTIWVNSKEALNVSKKILAGGSSSAQRFVFNVMQDAIGGGVMVRTYLNRFSMSGGSTLDIRVHPNMPAGAILMTSRSIPYPLSGVGNVFQIRTRRDYYQIEWPLRARRYEYGVYADEVLQHYFPPSMAIIANIGNG